MNKKVIISWVVVLLLLTGVGLAGYFWVNQDAEPDYGYDDEYENALEVTPTHEPTATSNFEGRFLFADIQREANGMYVISGFEPIPNYGNLDQYGEPMYDRGSAVSVSLPIGTVVNVNLELEERIEVLYEGWRRDEEMRRDWELGRELGDRRIISPLSGYDFIYETETRTFWNDHRD